MQKNCKQCGEKFEITEKDQEFLKKVSPVIAGKKYLIPNPSFCPDCRQQRRLVFRNERSLYKGNCDLCKKSMISCFEDVVSPVYCQECWWSDKWDPMDYARDFDFNKPFFPQFQDFLNVVPQLSLPQFDNENSEYNTFLAFSKNTYLSAGSHFLEDCYYIRKSSHCKDCLDSTFLSNCELVRFSVNSKNCYNSQYLINCMNCSDCSYLANSSACKNCFMSVNLNNKEFYFKNKSYDKDEYLKIVKEYKQKDPDEVFKEFSEFNASFPKRYQNQLNCEKSSGDYIYNCKNAIECYDCYDIEDSKYIVESVSVKDSMDLSTHDKDIELCYEISSGGDSNKNLCFSYCSCRSANSFYLYLCFNLKNSFACASIHEHKSNCIFNKQYSAEECEKLKAKIIEHMIETGEWGEFFPVEISPFSYNETSAQDSFPLKKEEALELGFKWRDDDLKQSKSIAENVHVCKKCNRNYKVIDSESKLLKRLDLPVSPYCPNCRQSFLLSLKNPRKLWDRKCDKCATSIKTTYSPERSEIVYCEKCYLEEVY